MCIEAVRPYLRDVWVNLVPISMISIHNLVHISVLHIHVPVERLLRERVVDRVQGGPADQLGVEVQLEPALLRHLVQHTHLSAAMVRLTYAPNKMQHHALNSWSAGNTRDPLPSRW